MSAESKFVEAVATFSHGNRYDHYLSTVRLGLIARNGDETAVYNYIMTNAPTPSPNPSKVRSAIRYAVDHPLPDQPFTPSRRGFPILTPQERAEARRRLLPKSARNFVPVTLRDYWKTTFTRRTTNDAFAGTIRMSDDELYLINADEAYRLQAARELRALFRPGDLIWAGFFPKGGYKTAFDGKALHEGGGVVEAYDLAKRIEAGNVEKIPTHISLNPVTGGSVEKPNTDGKGTHPSYNCKETVAAYRHALIEFDDLYDLDAQDVKIPSQDQIEIVAGLCDYSFETELIRVVCAHHTGGKSIHTVLNIKADDLASYKRQLAAAADLFASADDPRFRADLSPFRNPATLFRLAGAIRPETGRHARLLWCNP